MILSMKFLKRLAFWKKPTEMSTQVEPLILPWEEQSPKKKLPTKKQRKTKKADASA